MLIALGASNFVYFYWYTALKAGSIGARDHRRASKARRVQRQRAGRGDNLLLASVAGSVNVLACTPLWVAYTRLALQRKTKSSPAKRQMGLLSTVVSIARKEGLAKLWSGLIPSLILVSNPSVQFVSYEKLKSWALLLKRGHVPDTIRTLDDEMARETPQRAVPEFSNVEYLVLGALAKMVATVVTYPLQVAQARLRASGARER